ncbi:MAG TPA: zf-HC2 domain-containing protein, partial [Draconibacterium sp.]|nr:zf-HC2 domain-containing protein [Draconibacterium sp.]
MKCKSLHTKIIFYLDGELPAAEMEQMRIHLSECSDCAAFAAEMEKTFAVLAAEKSPEVNP